MEIVSNFEGIVKSYEIFHLVVYDDNEDIVDEGHFEGVADAKSWASSNYPENMRKSQYNLFKVEHFRRTTSIK